MALTKRIAAVGFNTGDGKIEKIKKLDLENLDEKEIKKIKSLACLNELNIFYDRNRIIIALCNKILENKTTGDKQ